MTPNTIERLIEFLQREPGLDNGQNSEWINHATCLDRASDRDIETFVDAMFFHSGQLNAYWKIALVRLSSRLHKSRNASGTTTRPLRIADKIAAVYARSDDALRGSLLSLLSAQGNADGLRTFADLVVTDPPQKPDALAEGLTPFFSGRDLNWDILFPRLFDALQHLSVAASIIDFSNYLAREKLVDTHPAAERSKQMIGLLGSLVDRLALLEEHPTGPAVHGKEIGRQVADSTALVISLCDAVSLIGDNGAVGKLRRALQLRHRRIRVEAAAALVRLEGPSRAKELTALAKEPIVRERVLAYARELEILDKVDIVYGTKQARAEAQLITWLAEPTQFGTAPSECLPWKNWTLYWPGFEEPIACYLFRFAYDMTNGRYENIGLAGPIAHAFAADLTTLPHNDTFAAFAGWHVEHPELFKVEIDRLAPHQHQQCAQLMQLAAGNEFDNLAPCVLVNFFDECYLVATASRRGKNGFAVIEPQRTEWIWAPTGPRPIRIEEAYYISVGRRLLSSFNPDFQPWDQDGDNDV